MEIVWPGHRMTSFGIPQPPRPPAKGTRTKAAPRRNGNEIKQIECDELDVEIRANGCHNSRDDKKHSRSAVIAADKPASICDTSASTYRRPGDTKAEHALPPAYPNPA